MFKSTFLMSISIIFLSACSSSQPPIKFDANGNYIGWHCSAHNPSSPTWRCVQNADQDQKTVADSTADTTDSEADRPDTDTLIAESDKSSTQRSHLPTDPAVISGKGYKLQLGAYSSRILAVAAAQKIAVNQGLQITQLLSKQKPVFVILYGHFASRDEAQQAALLLAQTNPHLAYWIRSTASIDRAQLK